jgi:hypothetical protein
MTGGWSSAKPKTRSNNIRLSEEIDMYEFPKKKWVKVRMFGPITSYSQLWFEIISSKQKKKVKIPKICLDYNSLTEEFEEKGCPFRKLGGQMTQNYIINFIVRDIQEDGPTKNGLKYTDFEKKKRDVLGEKWRVKEKGSKTWTPVRAKEWSATMAEKFQSLKTLNVVKNKDGVKKEYDITHPKFGRDILLKWDPDSKSPIKWEIQLEERTPLTEEELEYCIQPLTGLESIKPMELSAAKAEAKGLAGMLVDKDSRKDIDDDDDEAKPKKKKRVEDDDDDDDEPVVKKKKRPVDEEEDDDDDSDDDSEEDDDDDSDDDDDDSDDDSEEEDDDDEDEPPKKVSKNKLGTKAKSKHRDDDDDDDDEPVVKKSSKNKIKDKKKKKKPVDDDEFDDDDEF